MKIGIGMGLIVCVLLPIVFYLFGVLHGWQPVSAILLLCGVWAVTYGIAFGGIRNRLYNVGVGIVIVAISTFIFIPLQYVLGLVLISIIAIVVTSVAMTKNKTGAQPAR
jgi:hypothetical protein